MPWQPASRVNTLFIFARISGAVSGKLKKAKYFEQGLQPLPKSRGGIFEGKAKGTEQECVSMNWK